MEPGEALKKVLEFRQKCIDDKKIFFKPFSDVQTFREAVRSKIEEIGWLETEIFNANETQQSQPGSISSSASPQSAETPIAQQNGWLFGAEAREFLRDFADRDSEWDNTTSVDVARLRLLGSSVMRLGNDETYLGNHDANLIFRESRNARLSRHEINALIDCGVVGFQHQYVPLWRWLSRAASSDAPWDRIRLLAIIGTDNEKRYAIDILRLASQPIPTLDLPYDKRRVLSSWLSDEAVAQVFDAAVSFLASNAEPDDLPIIEDVSAQCSPGRQSQIEAAIVRILSRTSVDDALKRLVEKRVDKIDPHVAAVLFEHSQSLRTETVRLCLSAAAENIRVCAAHILFDRGEIPADLADTLLTDPSHEIRLIAVESLRRIGKSPDDDVIKKALQILKQQSSVGSGLLAQTDDTYYERYLMNRLLELDLDSLRSRAASEGVFDQRTIKAMYAKYPRQLQGNIRQNLADRFQRHFDERLQDGATSGVLEGDLLMRIKRLGPFLRNQLVSAAASALCTLKVKGDLPLLRMVLKEEKIEASNSILSYLSRFGEWSDIPLIEKLGETPPTSLLSMNAPVMPGEKADAIFNISRRRIADLMDLDIDADIRIRIIKLFSARIISDLPDDILLRELRRNRDRYRTVFALCCVKSLSKHRLNGLLERYLAGEEERFYNSVHWLDLGATFPHSISKRIAERTLALH